jgi:virulence-associated protein VagC
VIHRVALFRNGGSQAVRLPKALRFDEDAEVTARKVGKKVILEAKPKKRRAPAAWPKAFLASLGGLSDDVEAPRDAPPAPVAELE